MMADWSNIREAQSALVSPYTSGADLSAIAQAQPSLWAGVAVHPNAFPELLSWLGQYGDATVQAALASRMAAPQAGFATGWGPSSCPSRPDFFAQPGFDPNAGDITTGYQGQPVYSGPTSGYGPVPGYAAPQYMPGAPQGAYPQTPAKKSKLPWIIAGVAALVIVLIVVVAIVGVGGGGGLLGADVPKTPAELEQAVQDRDPINCTFSILGHKATVQTNNGWGKVKISSNDYGQDMNVLILENDGVYTWYSGVLKFGFKMPYIAGISDDLIDELVGQGTLDGTIDAGDFTCKAPVGDSAFKLPADIDFE
ncbi:MAG: hypothetical protein LBN10_06625 [Propionibacteriaceae bacterium]|jgi:hypothetical protein|nr:hypothetical protein [Propionibacteriaceae bacterium]